MHADDITVLAIDDSPDILFAIKAICDLENWKTVTTTNGQEACVLLEEHRPSIVLVDFHMPAINGLEVVKNIRRLDKQIPIMVLTVEDSRQIASEFTAAGASDFAIKPIRPIDLISRIRVHLNLGATALGAPAAASRQDDYVKGINNKTLEIVRNYLARQDDYRAIGEIADGCGLAYQTTYRYLTHLVLQGIAEVDAEYGKQGRPRQKYKIRG